MSIRLSKALKQIAESALQSLETDTLEDPFAMIPIVGTPFLLARMELVRAREDFLLHGVIKHPTTLQSFGIGLLARASLSK